MRSDVPSGCSAPLGTLVLVVDDDTTLRMVAVEMLQDAGFRTLEAADASAAVGMLERYPGVKVLFTDLEMPGGCNGVDLAREVHDRWPDILLLVTSGGVTLKDDEVPDDGRFLPKPYDSSTLIENVRVLIARGHGDRVLGPP